MVEERVKLLHGLGLERESSLSEWDEGEREHGVLWWKRRRGWRVGSVRGTWR